MNLAQEGAYLRLLSYQWLDGSIPADVETLAALCRVSVKEMRKLWSGSLPLCFKPHASEPGRLVNSRLEVERAAQAENRRKRAEAGKLGARSRWQSDGNAIADAWQTHQGAKGIALANDGSSSSTSSASAISGNGDAHTRALPPPLDDPEALYVEQVGAIFEATCGRPLRSRLNDFDIASGWFATRVPLDLVRDVMTSMAEKRKERGAKDGVSSLKYFDDAVRSSHAELRELTAPGEREQAEPIDVTARLESLAGCLRNGFADRVRGLSGTADQVEAELSKLDAEMIERTVLGAGQRAEVAAAVESTLAALRCRIPEDEVESSRERVTRQVVRQRLGLPHLSLFSPEAMK